MQFGVEFHAGSKSDAIAQLNGKRSLPPFVRALTASAINALAGEPSLIKVAIGGTHKDGALSKLSIGIG